MSATKMKAVVQTSGSHHHHLNSKYCGFHVALRASNQDHHGHVRVDAGHAVVAPIDLLIVSA